jgi:hypothetical protein
LPLCFLRGQNCLTLGFGLASNFGKPFRLRLPRGFGGFRGQSRRQLRLFLSFSLVFFRFALALRFQSFFHAQTRFLTSLCPRRRKITILCSVEIGPRIQSRYIIGSRPVVGIAQRLLIRHTHLQLSMLNDLFPTQLKRWGRLSFPYKQRTFKPMRLGTPLASYLPRPDCRAILLFKP